ncbi:hypothetical protein GCM10022409_01510 [Hymenobacter glaciei]|uniref:PKD domain-containing protein n=1 Tax=Hymenobacter glaciei TaxID=877209 RepID=A0ABP7T5Y2_9BACT
MQKSTLLVLLLLWCPRLALAQKEDSNWHFGLQAAVSFTSGTPVVQPTALRTYEAASSISDAAGQLLFYSNGEQVWNRNHTLMPNGAAISATGKSSTQGVLIVPHPGDPNRFYVFLTDEMENQLASGLRYTTVDMSLANGLGDVTGAAVRLATPTLSSRVAEKLIAVRHANGRDCWIVVHGWENNSFYSFLLTNTGLVSSPVTSAAGPVIRGSTSLSFGEGPYSNAAGYLRASPDGRHLAMATLYGDFGLYDFDAATGQVANYAELLPPAASQPLRYGIEFAADNSWLYLVVASPYQDFSVLQYDMLAGPAGAIASSRQVVGTGNTGLGALLRALNGKIYMASYSFLHVINAPGTLGAACNFQLNALSLNGAATIYNLPNQFNAAGRNGFVQFTAPAVCLGVATPFSGLLTLPGAPLAATWNFGEPTAGAANTASGLTATHTYSTPGSYTATLLVTMPGVVGTLGSTRQVVVSSPPTVSIGPAVQQTCGGTPIRLVVNSQPAGTTYRWQNGATTPFLLASAAGTYSVDVTSPDGCVGRAATTVQLLDCTILIPTIITPNGDASNQTFVLKGLNAADWSVRLYNRWGREVYTQERYDNGWAAQGQPAGVYYYLLNHPESGQQLKGWVEVVR